MKCKNQGFALLIGVRSIFAKDLILSLNQRNIVAVNINDQNIGDVHLSLSEPYCSSDYVETPCHGKVFLKDVIGTYSESVFGECGRENTKEESFFFSELDAALIYLRSLCARPINFSGRGSGPFCRSLVEQWELLNCSLQEVSVPEWSFAAPRDLTDGYIILENPYDYRLTPDKYTKSNGNGIGMSPCLVAKIPKGRRAFCVFSGTNKFHVFDNGEEWVIFQSGERLSKILSSVIELSRHEFGLDVGVIDYFYNGSVSIWSVSPYFEVGVLPDAIVDEFVNLVADAITGRANKALDSAR